MIDRTDAEKSVARVGMFTSRAGRTLVDVFISRHPHFLEMKRRRRKLRALSGAELWFISAEDLCIMKLIYGRSKDIPDLERMFATMTMDLAYVRTWLTKMVSAGDRRFAILDDLERRFTEPG